MNIPIGKYWLSSDRHNYVISKPPVKGNDGKVRYPDPTYHSNLSSAFTDLLGRRLRQTDAATLKELKSALDGHREELSTFIKEELNTDILIDAAGEKQLA